MRDHHIYAECEYTEYVVWPTESSQPPPPKKEDEGMPLGAKIFIGVLVLIAVLITLTNYSTDRQKPAAQPVYQQPTQQSYVGYQR